MTTIDIVGFKCGLCGETMWNTGTTKATIKRVKHDNGKTVTTTWEINICDKCLDKMGVSK